MTTRIGFFIFAGSVAGALIGDVFAASAGPGALVGGILAVIAGGLLDYRDGRRKDGE